MPVDGTDAAAAAAANGAGVIATTRATSAATSAKILNERPPADKPLQPVNRKPVNRNPVNRNLVSAQGWITTDDLSWAELAFTTDQPNRSQHAEARADQRGSARGINPLASAHQRPRIS
jgi:hypothetical protein